MTPLFTIPFWQFDLNKKKEWTKKKEILKNLIKQYPYKREDHFDTNRHSTGLDFIGKLSEVLEKPLKELSQELKTNIVITKGWSTRFKKGDLIVIHKHASVGLSGTLYLNYNATIHPPTTYKQPFSSYWNDYTFCRFPPIKEGYLVIVPSHLEHFTLPNLSKIPKEIIGFDMRVVKAD